MKQPAADSVQRPSLALLGAEPFRAAMDLTWHSVAKYGTTKPGDGHPVVIFPGLGANGGSVATLREHCRSLGYDADWGQGFNTGPAARRRRAAGVAVENTGKPIPRRLLPTI